MPPSCKDIAEHILIHEIIGIEATENTASGVNDFNLTICDEGNFVASGVNKIDFIGTDVEALPGGPGEVKVFIPPHEFLSHWNTADGSNGSQAVSEDVSRTTQRIATPSGGEGSPFITGGWAGTNQDATLSGTANFTTPGDITGLGGDSVMVVTVYDGNGAVLETFTTPVLAGNNVHTSTSGDIVVTVTNFGADGPDSKGDVEVDVDVGSIFTTNGLDGGRYRVEIDHTTDSAAANAPGTTFSYVQDDVFYDTNATTPSVGGPVTIAEGTTVVTKHLSGIEYYTLGSEFAAVVNDIDQLNKNTAAVSSNLRIRGQDYGLPTLNHSPFGTGSGFFTGWTNIETQDDVVWSRDDWAITQSNYCFIGTTGNIDARARDGWNNGSTVNGPNAAILVDTYGIQSTNTFDHFVDEDRRLESDYTTAWDSERSLVAGEALVQCSFLMVPNQSTLVGESSAQNADWTSYKPDLNGTNPDYSALGVGSGVSWYRIFTDTSGNFIPNMTWIFTGTFAGGNALTDLTNEDLQIFVRKVSGVGNSGTGSPALNLHGTPFNAGFFDDGNTNGQIRLGSSSGNTIQSSFGTFTMQDGIYVEIRIANNATKLNSIQVIFNS